MPKLGTGVTLDARASGSASRAIALYEDNFVSYPTNSKGFQARPFFNSGPSASTTWGGGSLSTSTAGNARHLICHFDCLKDKYPAWSGSVAYVAGDVVYGREYGHGLFIRTGQDGLTVPPNFSTLGQSGGWTRYRPLPREIQPGAKLTASFDFRATSPATIASNSFRFGLFSSGANAYVIQDDISLSGTAFEGYKGYMATYGSTLQKIFRRTELSSQTLINTTNNATTGLPIWTEYSTSAIAGISPDTTYRVTITASRSELTPSYLTISSKITGSGVAGTITYTDTTPNTFCFDTLVAYTTANASTAFQIRNVRTTYSGKPWILPSGGCSDLDARLWIYGVNGVWSSGPRTLTRVADRHYVYIGGDEVVKHNGTAWEYYFERPIDGKVVIKTAGGNEAWPWLVPWAEFTSQKLCLPPVYPAYRGGDTIYTIGDRVSHNGGNFVCIYNAGSVGYGPFGGYLNGELDGIIYWLPE
jgi:hypothetical protein